MKPMYYYPDGTPIVGSPGDPHGTLRWAFLFEQERHLADSTLPNGIRVSTVWMGLDHNHLGSGPPLIFESMAFAAELTVVPPQQWHPNGFSYHEELDCERYASESEALAGHLRMCEKFCAGCRTLPALP